ncbi:hypothetical protein C4579_04295 [Candidatus Microgenomates bacterium]|nr:MAG: hypothetical protein C4579_04295 [Candidatus Microgenomates bacterium]
MAKPVAPVRSTTQSFLEIEDIKNDLLLLSDGSAALVIETTAVNFSLLSEREQDAMIYAYSGMLNSLSFPIQIYIRSERKDISAYLENLTQAEAKQTDPVLAKRIKAYREFITTTVKERNVLDKKFYLVLPFSALELGVGNVRSVMGQKGLPYPKNYILERANTVLLPKRDTTLRHLARLGLKGTHLTNQRLVELFYSIYNADVETKMQPIQSYQTAIVSK